MSMEEIDLTLSRVFSSQPVIGFSLSSEGIGSISITNSPLCYVCKKPIYPWDTHTHICNTCYNNSNINMSKETYLKLFSD